MFESLVILRNGPMYISIAVVSDMGNVVVCLIGYDQNQIFNIADTAGS